MDPLTSLVLIVVVAAVVLYAVYVVVRKAVRAEFDARDARTRHVDDSPAADA